MQTHTILLVSHCNERGRNHGILAIDAESKNPAGINQFAIRKALADSNLHDHDVCDAITIESPVSAEHIDAATAYALFFRTDAGCHVSGPGGLYKRLGHVEFSSV